MPVALYAVKQLERLSLHINREAKTHVEQARTFLDRCITDPKAAWRAAAARAISPTPVLIALWIWLLCWGEMWSFDIAINKCDWPNWEDWPAGAAPHHIALVADPQLVDPHTYPGRSWPLSALTIKHTDLYMRRAYSRIQQKLDPNTIFFLGDLFDGGREWSTPFSQSPEYIYRQYGDEYWLQEYDRFADIFLREWKDDRLDLSKKTRDARRIIASLPGNHDLGFARGVRKPVRDRFNSFFGDGNRIDVIGNHTFVSIDSPSLSAAEQPAAAEYAAIWGPPQDFLNSAKTKRYQAIANYLDHMYGTSHQSIIEDQRVYDIETTTFDERADQNPPQIELPTILLTHVPFYRAVGEPCGPLRERNPPTPPPKGKPGPVYPDEKNAIVVVAGYQYQNVLSYQVSSLIATKLGGAIEHVFSGDDHDYCEVVHKDYDNPGSGIREITVKSISEAMGVRKPGFLLVSLWNPIDSHGQPLTPAADGKPKTLQTKLCLLPDILSIVINYAIFIGISMAILLIRAVVVTGGISRRPHSSVLPTFSSASKIEKDKPGEFNDSHQSLNHVSDQPVASTSSADETGNHLSSRNSARTRSTSPLPSLEPHPLASTNFAPNHSEKPRVYSTVKTRSRGRIRMILYEWAFSIWRVAWIVIVWYLILWRR